MGAINATADRRSEIVIPPGSGGAPERDEDKGRKMPVNFRMPAGLLDYIDSQRTSDSDRSRVIIFGLNFYRDFLETMGDEWWELTKRAAIDRVRPGFYAAKLVLEALKKPPKK